MTTKEKKTGSNGDKPKAVRVDVGQLIVTAAYAKTFSTGSRGFFGTAICPANGKRYQIIGAVEVGSKS